MGRTVTPKYKLAIMTPGLAVSLTGWSVKENGKPTQANLNKYMANYLESLKPGGVNEHVIKTFGFGAVPEYARLSLNQPDAPTLVEWVRQ